MIVIFPETDEEVVPQWESHLSRWDDAMWSRMLRQPFSWQLFLNWWVARRWLIPRDVRRS